MIFGKQHRHCPNCGIALYDDRLTMDRVQPLMCSKECRDSWEMKYTRMCLGKSAEPKEVPR